MFAFQGENISLQMLVRYVFCFQIVKQLTVATVRVAVVKTECFSLTTDKELKTLLKSALGSFLTKVVGHIAGPHTMHALTL